MPDSPLNLEDPSRRSGECEAMQAKWRLISDVLEGVAKVRGTGRLLGSSVDIPYLPQFTGEEGSEYARRRQDAPWRPEFADILQTIASKPFGKEVSIKGEASEGIIGTLDPATNNRVGGFVEDVDGRGSGLTVFAKEWFFQAIAKGVHLVLVDYPHVGEGLSRAEEVAANARPYWVHIRADQIIAMYSDMVGGEEVITHLRYSERITRKAAVGFGEEVVDRIRVFEPGSWEVWERQAATGPAGTVAGATWIKVDGGPMMMGGRPAPVPVVQFFTGERSGTVRVSPPLYDLAEMQIELYRALSRQDEILTYAGAPMLSAENMVPDKENPNVAVGPGRVLWATPSLDGSPARWTYVQPEAANIKEIRDHVVSIIGDMQRLGMKPMLDRTGNPTATGKAIDTAQAHSPVKSWALMLNDAIERAFSLTTGYMGEADSVETEVNTDFTVMLFSQPGLAALQAARATGDISWQTYVRGLKRFGVLPEDFDESQEEGMIAAEVERKVSATLTQAKAMAVLAPQPALSADRPPPEPAPPTVQESIQARI